MNIETVTNYLKNEKGFFPDLFSKENLQFLLKTGLQILLILAIGYFVNKFVSRLITAFTKKKDTQQSATLNKVFTRVIKYVIYFFVLCAILDIFGISVASILAVAGIGSVALGFGAQSLVKDLINGIFILSEEQYNIGDYVAIEDKMGLVEEVGLRTTILRNAINNEQYIIPNGDISIVTNLTKDFQRAVVNLEIPFDRDLDTIISVLEKAVESYDGGDKILSKPVVQGVTAFTESAMDVRILCDCKAGEAWAVERELRRLLKYRMEEENIFIPFQTRTIHIIDEKSS